MNNRKSKTLKLFATILVLGWVFAPSGNLHANRNTSDKGPHEKGLKGWNTNTAKRTIELNELISGGPGKDGIPAINKPKFVKPPKAAKWLKPVEPVISVVVNDTAKAYPYSITRNKRVINDEVGGQKIVIFHDRGAASALDKAEIALSREDGSTGVFRRKIAGQLLTFSRKDDTFMDDQTSSIWDITGRAIQGELKGKKLSPVVHGDYFAFAWLVFKPETKIYTD